MAAQTNGYVFSDFACLPFELLGLHFTIYFSGKGGISAILARYHMKTRQNGCETPSAILSRKGITPYGGVSRTGLLSPTSLRLTWVRTKTTENQKDAPQKNYDYTHCERAGPAQGQDSQNRVGHYIEKSGGLILMLYLSLQKNDVTWPGPLHHKILSELFMQSCLRGM